MLCPHMIAFIQKHMSMVLLLASLLREKKVRSIKLVMQQSNQPNASNKAKNQQTFTISTKTDVILCIWQQLIQRFSMVFFFVFLCCFGCSVIFFLLSLAFVLLLFCFCFVCLWMFLWVGLTCAFIEWLFVYTFPSHKFIARNSTAL